MLTLHSLRNTRLLTRLVLVWFALFVGVAVASPVVHPEGAQLVCTTAGQVKMVQLDADGQEALDGPHGLLHCPLCLPVAAPPMAPVQTAFPIGLSYSLHALEQARLAPLIGLPWQARAPPSFS